MIKPNEKGRHFIKEKLEEGLMCMSYDRAYHTQLSPAVYMLNYGLLYVGCITNSGFYISFH